MYTIIKQLKNIGCHACLKETSIYFAIELSFREISFVA